MKNKIKSLIKKFGFSIESKRGGADPVCGMEGNGMIKADYQGKSYNFCSDHCRKRFVSNPQNFAT